MDSYELIYGYMHCIGKTTYPAGVADSREAAEQWVRQKQCAKHPAIRVPDSDPIRWCPVRHCHMKAQKPWFAWRRIDPAEKDPCLSGCSRSAETWEEK